MQICATVLYCVKNRAMRTIGHEPISCFCIVRQLDVQVHALDMMHKHKDLPPIQPLMLSAKQYDTAGD